MLDLVSQQGGTGFLYTKKEIENIFRKIDLDKTNSIDFFECIEVCKSFIIFVTMFMCSGY